MRRDLFAGLAYLVASGCGANAPAPSGFETGDPESDSDETGDETDSEGEPGVWETLAPLPAPRQDAGVAGLQEHLYVVGGITEAEPLVAVTTVDVYDPIEDAWAVAPSVPVPMHHVNLAAVGDALFVVGFSSGPESTEQGDVFSWRPGEASWQSLTPMPAGRARGAAGVAVESGQVWVFGGLRQGQAVSDASTYLVVDNLWLDLPPMPGPRDHLIAEAIQGKIYVAAGRDTQVGNHSETLWIFDPKTEEWSTAAPLPTSRASAAGAGHEGRLYLFGGEGNSTRPDGLFAESEVYDPIEDAWHALVPMPHPRHAAGGASLGDRIHVVGGADASGYRPVATHEAWRVAG